jgi:hypothetical protein
MPTDVTHQMHETSSSQEKMMSTAAAFQRPHPEVWLPPTELRCCFVHRQGKPRALFFAIELKNKDYLRRIFDVVALGIQNTVQRLVLRHRDSIGPIGSKKKPYDFDQTCDLYYLIKHVTDPKSAPVYALGAVFVC